MKKLLAALEQIVFIKFDPETNLLLIRNALKYQFPENPNQIGGAIRRIKDLPNSALLAEFQVLVRKYCYRKGASSEVQGFPHLLDQALAQRLPEPLGQSLPLSPPQAQAQTTTLPLTRLNGDGEERDFCLSLDDAERERRERENELRSKYPFGRKIRP